MHCLWKCTLWKTVWRFLKKLKIELPYDPEIPLLGLYPKECKSGYNKGTCTPMVIVALFTIAKQQNSQDAPLLMNEENVVFTYDGILLQS
jgi:hypothetical protein